ncbi:MAG TPA: hypothetical protein VH682_17715 [Gemmataceae bacterium]|jgi:hypothetical protein
MIHGEVNVVRRQLLVGTYDAATGELISREETGVFLDFLTVNGQRVPLEHFETIPEEPLEAEPLGYVNLHNEACAARGEHFHLLWINENGDLRISTVTSEDRWAQLPHIFVGG